MVQNSVQCNPMQMQFKILNQVFIFLIYVLFPLTASELEYSCQLLIMHKPETNIHSPKQKVFNFQKLKCINK